jgi:hypothetical protein
MAQRADPRSPAPVRRSAVRSIASPSTPSSAVGVNRDEPCGRIYPLFDVAQRERHVKRQCRRLKLAPSFRLLSFCSGSSGQSRCQSSQPSSCSGSVASFGAHNRSRLSALVGRRSIWQTSSSAPNCIHGTRRLQQVSKFGRTASARAFDYRATRCRLPRSLKRIDMTKCRSLVAFAAAARG